MKKYLYIVCILFCSCQVTEVSNNIKTIDFNDYYSTNDEVEISDISSKIDYIPLETNNLSLIGDIDQIKVFNDYIIVLDNTKRLFVFDKKGKFISMLDFKGRGPNEYTGINDFTYVEKENVIAIYSKLDNRRVLLYSVKGKFVNSFQLPNELEKLYEFDDNFLFYNSHFFRNQTNSNSLSVISNKGKLINQLLEKNKEKSIPFFYQYDRKTSIFKLNDNLVLWEKGFDNGVDTIWNINKKLEAHPKYIMNIGGEKLPLERYIDKKKITSSERREKTDIIDYLESERYIFCSIIHSEKLNRFIYDKKTSSLKRVYHKTEEYKGMLKNNLDYLSPFWPEAIFSENKMYKIVYGFELKNFAAKMDPNDKKDNNLIKIIENSQITDNPILMVVTLNK